MKKYIVTFVNPTTNEICHSFVEIGDKKNVLKTLHTCIASNTIADWFEMKFEFELGFDVISVYCMTDDRFLISGEHASLKLKIA